MSLNPFVSYRTINVGEIPESKLRKALDGLTVRLSNKDLSGDRVIVLHKANIEKIKKAKRYNKGVSIDISPFEAAADIAMHEIGGTGLHGGSLFKFLKKKIYPMVKKFLVNNWESIKPLASVAADAAAPMISKYTGVPDSGEMLREGIRRTVGFGVDEEEEKEEKPVKPKTKRKSRFVKGSPEAREYMASIRSRVGGKSTRMP